MSSTLAGLSTFPMIANRRRPGTVSRRIWRRLVARSVPWLDTPVATGLVASPARPGSDITRGSSQGTDLATKRLQILRETVPGLRRLGIMGNVDNPASVLDMAKVHAAARTHGLDAAIFEIRGAEDLVPTFEALKGRMDALYIPPDALINTQRIRINTLALGARLPTMYGAREYVEGGVHVLWA